MLRRDLRCVIPPLVMNQPWRQPPEKGFHVLNAVRPQSCSNYDPKVGGSIVISNPKVFLGFLPFDNFSLKTNKPHHHSASSLGISKSKCSKNDCLACGVKPAISTRPRITKLYQIQVTPSFCWILLCVFGSLFNNDRVMLFLTAFWGWFIGRTGNFWKGCKRFAGHGQAPTEKWMLYKC